MDINSLSKETKYIIKKVKQTKNERKHAESKYNSETSRIGFDAQYKTINLSRAGALDSIMDIYNRGNKAADDYYTTLVALFNNLDNECRPLLDNGVHAYAVKKVVDEMGELLESCDIRCTFSGSFRGDSGSDIQAIQYIAPLEQKAIEKEWIIKYNRMPSFERKEAEKEIRKEREEELEKEKEYKQYLREVQENIKQQEEDKFINNYKNMKIKFLTSIKSELDKKSVEENDCANKLKEYHSELEKESGNLISYIANYSSKRRQELTATVDEINGKLNDTSYKKQRKELNIQLDEVEAELYFLDETLLKNRLLQLESSLENYFKKYEADVNYYLKAKYSKKVVCSTNVITGEDNENGKQKDIIVKFLISNGKAVTIIEIMEEFKRKRISISNQKLSALCEQLCKNYFIKRENRNRKAYFFVPPKAASQLDDSLECYIADPNKSYLSMPSPIAINELIEKENNNYQTSVNSEIAIKQKELAKRHKKFFLF